MRTKLVLLFIATLVFFTGYYFGHRQLAPSLTESNACNATQLTDQFRHLTENEISEYYELKTMEERYKKADEILAKIMTIFMAEFGLRLSDRALVASRISVDLPSASCSAPITPSDPDGQRRVESKPQPPAEEVARAPVTAEELARLRTPKLVKAFLDKNKIENLSQTIAASKSFSNVSGLVELIQGRFVGPAHVVEGEKPVEWEVRVFLNAPLREGKLDGASEIVIAKAGVAFSTSRGEGSVEEWREGGSGGMELFIKASPNVYFQIYYLKASDSFIGNVYRRGSTEAFAHIGNVNLYRN